MISFTTFDLPRLEHTIVKDSKKIAVGFFMCIQEGGGGGGLRGGEIQQQ